MDSTSEIGAEIIEAGASGNLAKLKVIRKKVGDDREFRRICDTCTDVSSGRSVLHYAAEMGHLELCKFLLKNVKVHIDASTYLRDTPLIGAAKEEHVKIVEYLINQGARVRLGNSKGLTPLHYAVLKDNMELMELLLVKGAHIEADSVEGTPLQCAASRGNVEAVKFLLSQGAKPNVCFFVLDSPLSCAIKAHSFECMDLLLKAQADPNKFFFGLSPLSHASKEGDTKFLKSLLEAGADPKSPMIGLVKPIEDAALALNLEGVEILFPLTEPIPDYPNWTVDGIMEYCHSEEAKTKREESRSKRLEFLDKAGQVAVIHKEYDCAIVYYKEAASLDPSNPKWASKRSLCHANGGKRIFALHDAQEAVRLKIQIPDPAQYEDHAAFCLFQKLHMAAFALMLTPHDKVSDDKFRLALFEYLSWMHMTSSAVEILSFLC